MSDKYTDLFRLLNIPVTPLLTDYTPEKYGRQLYAMGHSERGVSYTSSTDYMADSKKNTDMPLVLQN